MSRTVLLDIIPCLDRHVVQKSVPEGTPLVTVVSYETTEIWLGTSLFYTVRRRGHFLSFTTTLEHNVLNVFGLNVYRLARAAEKSFRSVKNK